MTSAKFSDCLTPYPLLSLMWCLNKTSLGKVREGPRKSFAYQDSMMSKDPKNANFGQFYLWTNYSTKNAYGKKILE